MSSRGIRNACKILTIALVSFAMLFAGATAANASPENHGPSGPGSHAGASPFSDTGAVVDAYLVYDGTNLVATGQTFDWNRGTITIEANLWYGSSLEWDPSNTCYNATSCSIPSDFKICPGPGHWELYVYVWGPSTSGQTFKSSFAEVDTA